MISRRIKVLSTVGSSGTIETNVRTLGELKPLLSTREINYSGMKMMVGETRNELNLDEAVLPEGDFKLYLMPAKTKSGNNSLLYSRIADNLGNLADLFEQLSDEVGDMPTKIAPQHNEDPDLSDLRSIANGGSNSSWL